MPSGGLRHACTATGLAPVLAMVVALVSVQSGHASTVLERHGQLQASGNQIIDSHGRPVRFRGMSMFWSQWSEYWNEACLDWLVSTWNVQIVRAAMGVQMG